MARRAARPSVLSEGSFGAFVLDQLSELGDVVARPMFGGAGFYLDGSFSRILYDERLSILRVSAETIGEYTARKMKPFAPFARQARDVPRLLRSARGDSREPGRLDQMGAQSGQRTPGSCRSTSSSMPPCRSLRAAVARVTCITCHRGKSTPTNYQGAVAAALPKLIQPRSQRGREEIGLFTIRAARAQGGSQVIVGQAIRDAHEPGDVGTGDVRGGVRGALPLIAELHDVAVDAGDELRVLAGERFGVPSPALDDVVAPGAERRAPIDDQIARFASGPPEADPAGSGDTRRLPCWIRARRRGRPCCPSSRPASSGSSSRSVRACRQTGCRATPSRARRNACSTPGSLSSKRASVKRCCSSMHAFARRRSLAPSIVPDGTKYVGSAKYPSAHASRVPNVFGVHFVAPLHAPFAPGGIANRHAGLRTCVVLFEKVERRRRRALRSARSGLQILRRNRSRIAPNDLPARP